VRPTIDVGDWHTYLLELGQASAADRHKGNDTDSNFEQYPLTNWQPVAHVAKNWCDVLKLARTDHHMGGCVENYLQSANDKRRYAVQNGVAVINPAGNEGNSQSRTSVGWLRFPYSAQLLS